MNGIWATSAALSASAADGQVPQVVAVDADHAGGRVDQPDREGGDRRLAGAGRADEGDRAALGDDQADVVQHGRAVLVVAGGVDHVVGADLGAGRVGVRHAVEGQPGRRVRLFRIYGAVTHLAVGRQHVLEPVPAGHAARQLGQHPADRAHREGQHGEQERDADQVGHGDVAGPQPERADDQHGERAEAGQRLHQRVEQAAQPADRDQRVAQLAGAGGEPVGLLTLAAHRLDHQRAVEALVRDRADLAAHELRAGLPRRHPARVEDVDQEQAGEGGHADQGQHPVGEEERPDGADQHHQRADRERQRRDREPGGLDVGVGVGQQRAGRVPVVPGQRQVEVAAGDQPPVAGLQAELHVAGAEPAAEDADHPEHADRRAAATAPSQSSALSTAPSSIAGTMILPTMCPITYALPTTRPPKRTLPPTAKAKMRGSSRMARPSTRKPRASTSRLVTLATMVAPLSCRTVDDLTPARPG